MCQPSGVTDIDRVQELVTRSRAATRVSGSLAVLPPPVLFEAIARARADLRLVMREPRTGGVVVVVFNQGEPTMVFSPGDGRSVGELLLAAGHIDHATLTTWVQERPQSPASLARQVRERTNLEQGEVQRMLDFQARVRLLDALVWREGFFELQDYRGGNETAFRLELPNLASLVVRAEARGAALPRLLARLPATPVNTLARRRRGGVRPAEGLEASIFTTLDEPLLIPQLVARLLVDDDLIIDSALRLADRKVLVLQPRVELTADEGDETAVDPRLATLLRQVLDRYRGAGAAHGVAALWVVLVSASPNDAADLVTHLGGEPGEVMLPGDTVARTGFASRTLRLAGDARLRLLALRPDNLSRGALEGVLARCDAVALVRVGGSDDEVQRLQELGRLAEGSGAGWRPLTLGLDLGSGLRPWGEFPDAVLGIREWREREASWIVERLLEGLLAAASCRAAQRP
jgi:hypothetical protein